MRLNGYGLTLQSHFNNTYHYKQKICKAASSFNKKSNDVKSIVIPYNEYVEYDRSFGIIWALRTPANLRLRRDIRMLQNQMTECAKYGADKIDSNYRTLLNDAYTKKEQIRKSRTAFEKHASKNNSLRVIEKDSKKFLKLVPILAAFRLRTGPKRDAFIKKGKRIYDQAKKYGKIDDIDKLRQEYVDYNVTVPKRKEFTSVRKVTVSNRTGLLNYGNYNFAIITSKLTMGITGLKRTLGSKFIITSGYRNPKKQVTQLRKSATSRHCYGDAVDIGTYPKSDKEWKKIAKLVCNSTPKPSWVEPMYRSTNNHVHVDWGPKRRPGSSYCDIL